MCWFVPVMSLYVASGPVQGHSLFVWLRAVMQETIQLVNDFRS
jgi:hypothetical protein